MRLGIVGHLVTHAGFEHEAASVGEFGVQLSFDAEQDVPLRAPVIGEVAGRILDHANAEGTELAGAPECLAAFAPMFGRRDRGPVGRSERDV